MTGETDVDIDGAPARLVVIGGSWGGSRAVASILEQLDDELPLSIVVALHRGADNLQGALLSYLQARSKLPMCEADDKDPVRPGEVVVAPADYHLLVERGYYALSVDDRVQYSRPSIDVLFESAADAYGDRVIAVVLTGANQDGAGGVRAVKKHDGVTVAQDPATAERPEMPAAAVATGAVDHVLPLDGIAEFLRSAVGRR